jgi:cytochrome P450 family 710 subfamily A protein
VLQDASTASLVWVLTLMAEHPDVLERVRAEQAAARPDLDATITAETLTQMPYTRQVGPSVGQSVSTRGGAVGMRQGPLSRWAGERHPQQPVA